MPRSLAILQSSYLPWKGHFHLMQEVGEFMFFDTVQMTKRDWRSRNYIQTPKGRQLLTVPYVHAPQGEQTIEQVRIDNSQPWRRKHWESLKQNYKAAPHFKRYEAELADVYERPWESLSELNIHLMTLVAGWLGITTAFTHSRDFPVEGVKSDLILNLCRARGVERYVSGPAARDYMRLDDFKAAGIAVAFMAYDYPEYPQLHEPFTHAVTALDLLFNVGPDAPRYIWGDLARDWKKRSG